MMSYAKLLLIAASLGIAFSACNIPSAVFLVHQEEKEAPSTIEFINRSEKAEQYEWDFGDGTYSVETSPDHRYRNSGTYAVKLKALQGKKSRSLVKEVVVQPPSSTIVEMQTPHGSMMIELFDDTPLHRDNFVKLVSEGFYDSLMFHRVMEGFMIQGGDPNSRNAKPGAQLGSGSPGYQVPSEFNAALIHRKGALAAARTPDAGNPQKKSSGSQFYIVHGQTFDESQLSVIERRRGIPYDEEEKKIYSEIGGYPPLDMEYTVFGQVIDGLEVIDKIAAVETDGANRPFEDIRMKFFLIK